MTRPPLTERLEALTLPQRDALAQRLRKSHPAREPRARSGNTPQRLAAYFTAPAGEPDPAELRSFLVDRLPQFMIPTTFMPLPEFPLTPNGKIDRRALLAHPLTREKVSGGSLRPPSVIEDQLMRVWDEMLGAPDIVTGSNFFELGGHSLLVPRLIERVRCDFGVELPLGIIFEAPTVRELAARIHADNPRESWRTVVPIRPSGSRPPLFLVHGLGGEIGYCYPLAKYLHRDQPLYGVQAPVAPFDALDPMAAHYLQEIRAVQAHGPYFLGGFCVGGCVAYEIARQLAEAGEQVGLLALVDSVTPQQFFDSRDPGCRSLWTRVTNLATKNPRGLIDTVMRQARKASDRVQQSVGTNPEPSRLQLADLLDLDKMPTAYHESASRHFDAMRDYRPRPYPGKAILFRSSHEGMDDDLGWGALVQGGLTIESIPGHHSEVLTEPHLAVTGPKIAAATESALQSIR